MRVEDVEASLQAAHREWPASWVSRADFAAHCARVCAEGSSPVHAADLYLACACAAGVAEAVRAFETKYAAQLRAIVGRRIKNAEVAADVLQRVRERLFVAERGALAQYSGRSSLLAYARVVATRMAIDRLRESEPEVSIDDRLLDALTAGADPELQVVKAECRSALKTAFEDALGALELEARAILRAHLLEGRSIDELAAVEGIHRATAARRIEKARQDLRAALLRALRRRLMLGPKEAASLVRVVQSNIDLSLARVLANE